MVADLTGRLPIVPGRSWLFRRPGCASIPRLLTSHVVDRAIIVFYCIMTVVIIINSETRVRVLSSRPIFPWPKWMAMSTLSVVSTSTTGTVPSRLHFVSGLNNNCCAMEGKQSRRITWPNHARSPSHRVPGCNRKRQSHVLLMKAETRKPSDLLWPFFNLRHGRQRRSCVSLRPGVAANIQFVTRLSFYLFLSLSRFEQLRFCLCTSTYCWSSKHLH